MFPSDDEYSEFEAEMQRTEQLLESFEELGKENHAYMLANNLHYENMIHLQGPVIDIKEKSMRIRADHNYSVKTVILSQKAAALLQKDDILSLILGKRDKQWHVFFLDMFGGKNGETFVEVIDYDEDPEDDDDPENDGDYKDDCSPSDETGSCGETDPRDETDPNWGSHSLSTHVDRGTIH